MCKSLGKMRPSDAESNRPWRNRISSGWVQIRWNLKGDGELGLGWGGERVRSVVNSRVLRLMGSLDLEDRG